MRDLDKAPEIARLKRRADFLRVAKGARWHARSMTVQAAPSVEEGARVGFTLTRKVGCAVVRNRVRRRLKEAVRTAGNLPIEPGHDYVIIGRIDGLHMRFDQLQSELAAAFEGVRRRFHNRRPANSPILRPAPENPETR